MKERSPNCNIEIRILGLKFKRAKEKKIEKMIKRESI